MLWFTFNLPIVFVVHRLYEQVTASHCMRMRTHIPNNSLISLIVSSLIIDFKHMLATWVTRWIIIFNLISSNHEKNIYKKKIVNATTRKWKRPPSIHLHPPPIAVRSLSLMAMLGKKKSILFALSVCPVTICSELEFHNCFTNGLVSKRYEGKRAKTWEFNAYGFRCNRENL